jgi:hypothetical protein
MDSSDSHSSDTTWRGLYMAGAAGALLTAALFPLQMILYVGWPPPAHGTAADWFAFFQASPLHGLLSLDLVMMVEQVLVIPIVLALYRLLHRSGESAMALALAGWLVGATLFIASNTAFQMLSLSNGYAAATSDAARAPFLAAGEAMLATYWGQGTSFVFGYVLSAVAGVIVGAVMLRGRMLGHVAAYAAIAGNLLGLALFVPGIGVGLSLLSVVIVWVWYVLVGVRLVRLARSSTARSVSSAATAVRLAAS